MQSSLPAAVLQRRKLGFIRVDALDQSEVWDVFRVARRARPFELRTDGETFIEAAHDGFRRLANPLIHRRRVELGSGGLTITDRMEGRGEHQVKFFLHFHPEARASISLDGKFEASSIESKWYPEFNYSVPNRTLIGTWRGACPAECVTTVHPR
jgi:hypothetical protein